MYNTFYSFRKPISRKILVKDVTVCRPGTVMCKTLCAHAHTRTRNMCVCAHEKDTKSCAKSCKIANFAAHDGTCTQYMSGLDMLRFFAEQSGAEH